MLYVQQEINVYVDRDRSLSFFITSFVSLSQAPGPPLVRSPKSPTPSPHTHISMSILSQLPSETMGTPATDVDPIRLSTRGNEIPSSGDSVTFATNVVERACGGFLGDDDPYSLILGEKIDEKGGHLMDGQFVLRISILARLTAWFL